MPGKCNIATGLWVEDIITLPFNCKVFEAKHAGSWYNYDIEYEYAKQTQESNKTFLTMSSNGKFPQRWI